MNIMEQVKQTPLADRPLIDCNGVIQHMDDIQYAEHLQALAQISQLSPSLEEQIAALQGQVDDLTLLAADMIGGSQ